MRTSSAGQAAGSRPGRRILLVAAASGAVIGVGSAQERPAGAGGAIRAASAVVVAGRVPAGSRQTSEGPAVQASGPEAAAKAYNSLISPVHLQLKHTYFAVPPGRTASMSEQAEAAVKLKLGAWRATGARHWQRFA